MTATRPYPAPLVGRAIRLEPFDAGKHTDGLWRATARPEVFAGGYGGGEAGLPADRDAYAEWIAAYGTGPASIKFVARLIGGTDDGRIVGSSTLGDLDETLEHAHIGWTAWDPAVWATAVNPEAKLLMLGLAFDSGYGRARLQADDANTRSRAAIERLGARLDGVLRRERLRADGSWGGTAVYSILREEWPAVRQGLERRLEALPVPVVPRQR